MNYSYLKSSCATSFSAQRKSSVGILQCLKSEIELMNDSNHFGLARSYHNVMNVTAKYLSNHDVTLREIDARWVDRFARYLYSKGLKRNSVSCYLRAMRAVYNRAVDCDSFVNHNPFRGVYTGVDRTVKRAVDASIVRKIATIDLSAYHGLDFARDLFLFSIFMRGMAFVDIAYLSTDCIKGNTLSYARRKTAQRLSIYLEQPAIDIIRRYHVANNKRIFPILSDDDDAANFRQYQSALNLHNKRLRKIADLIGDGCSLSSYTARHTWATLARDRNVPIAIISAGMGHSSEATTRIYLDSIENSVVDRANRDLIKSLGL